MVTFDIQDGAAILTLDDGKANALSLGMAQALDAALDRAAAEARVVVVRGRPGVLCGGFDLRVIRNGDAAQRSAMTEAGMRLLARLYLLPQPVVVACTGHAVAAGALLLLTADVRIGLRGAFRIGLNETSIGLALPQAGIELARERLLPTALTEATLRARIYDPDEAARVGFLDSAADAGDFAAAVGHATAELLKLDPAAFAATKRRLRQGMVERSGGG
jgi:enoyl-CoA hydratase